MLRAEYSLTAAYIAIKFYGLTRIPTFRRLFDDQVLDFYNRLIPRFDTPLNRWHGWLQHAPARSIGMALEELMLPGDLLHIIARKWYTGNLLHKTRRDGFRQMVVLGTGFDHSAWQAAREGWETVVELDAPATAAFKQSFFRQLGERPRALHVFPFNLAATHPDNQIEPLRKLEPDVPTLVLAEGFFDYMTPAKASQLLDTVTGFTHAPLRLVSTVFDLTALPVIHRKVFEYSIRSVGERLLLGLDASEFRNLLENHQQFEIQYWLDYRQMQRELRQMTKTRLPMLKGFHLVSAERTKLK